MTSDFTTGIHPVDLNREPGHRGDGYRLERWQFTGRAGDRVPVEATLPQGRPAGAVLIGHGATSGKDAPYVRAVARSLARAGLAAFAPDLPGHGERAPAEPVDHLAPAVHRQMVGDLLRLAAAIEEWSGGDGLPLGYVGFSMGVVVGVPFLAAHGDVRSAVLVVGGSTRGLPIGSASPDPVDYAPEVDATDVLMLQADADEVFDRAAAFALFDAFSCPKQVLFFPGTHLRWERAAVRYRTIVAHLREGLEGGS